MTLLFRVSILLFEENGRETGIGAGYRASWTSERKPEMNDAMVYLASATVPLGMSIVAILSPFKDEAWEDVRAGDALTCWEGPHAVGRALVLQVFTEEDA